MANCNTDTPEPLKTVPAGKCEIIGEVGLTTAKPRQCKLSPKIVFTMNGLSPLYVCKSHGNQLRKHWGPHHDTETKLV